MASYPPPTQNTPIFNPDLFPEQNQPLTEADANLKYIQTSNADQSSGGTKTFSDLRSSDIAFTAPGKPLRWESGSGFGVSRLTPIPSVLFDKSYRLPVDDSVAIEELVGRLSSQVVNNKTLGQLKVGTNGTTATLVQYGRSSRSGTNPFTLTFPTAFSNTPTVVFNMEINNSSYLFTSQLMSVSTTNFTYRMYLITIANPALCTVAGDPHTINWVAYGNA